MDYYDNELTLYGLVRDVFAALSVTCFLFALHRIASALMIEGACRGLRRARGRIRPRRARGADPQDQARLHAVLDGRTPEVAELLALRPRA